MATLRFTRRDGSHCDLTVTAGTTQRATRRDGSHLDFKFSSAAGVRVTLRDGRHYDLVTTGGGYHQWTSIYCPTCGEVVTLCPSCNWWACGHGTAASCSNPRPK